MRKKRGEDKGDAMMREYAWRRKVKGGRRWVDDDDGKDKRRKDKGNGCCGVDDGRQDRKGEVDTW